MTAKPPASDNGVELARIMSTYKTADGRQLTRVVVAELCYVSSKSTVDMWLAPASCRHTPMPDASLALLKFQLGLMTAKPENRAILSPRFADKLVGSGNW